jgi:hypothetical protein
MEDFAGIVFVGWTSSIIFGIRRQSCDDLNHSRHHSGTGMTKQVSVWGAPC